jgi:hypothetical protein
MQIFYLRLQRVMDRRSFIQLVGSAPLLGTISTAVGVTSIYGIRLWPAPDHTRVVLDLDGQVEYKLASSGKPEKNNLTVEWCAAYLGARCTRRK